MEGTTAATLLLMTLHSAMAIVWGFALQLIHKGVLTVVTLVLLRHSVWDSEDAAGMILFQMFHIASTILVPARVSFPPTGKGFSTAKGSSGHLHEVFTFLLREEPK